MQIMTGVHGQRNPGKVDPSLTAHYLLKCCLDSVEDLTRNRIDVNSTIDTICLSLVCVAPPVVRVSMRTCSWVLSLQMAFFLSNSTAYLAR